MIDYKNSKIIVILAFCLVLLGTNSCGSNSNQIVKDESTNETTRAPEEEISSWDKYYLLSEKEQIEEVRKSAGAEINYDTWDEYQVLKFMSFICENEQSSYDPYGTIFKFIDTTKLTNYKSTLITYFCMPSAGSTGDINIIIQLNDKNEIFTKSVLTQVDDFFGFENLELKQSQVDFVLSGYSSSEVGMCCRDVQDTGKIYFKDGFPVLEFTSFNDYRINIYNLNYGPIFESWRFQLLVWGDAGVYSQDEIYRQAEKYNLKTGEVADGKEAILKKACEDFSNVIPKTDLKNPAKNISIPEVRKLVENWKKAVDFENELALPLDYMKTFIKIGTTEVISDENWMEGLREFNMLPQSEIEKIYDELKNYGSKINSKTIKTCSNYELKIVAPNDAKK